jgi:hypothetical protein
MHNAGYGHAIDESAFRWGASGQANDSRDQPGGLADLHCLGAPLGAQLVKQPA